jgi:hypothetical protein
MNSESHYSVWFDERWAEKCCVVVAYVTASVHLMTQLATLHINWPLDQCRIKTENINYRCDIVNLYLCIKSEYCLCKESTLTRNIYTT